MIYLKPWAIEDAIILAESLDNIKIWNNLRDYLPSPYTLEDAQTFIEKQKDLFPLQNFAIVCDEQIVGGIGINLLSDIYKMNVELGYWIAEPYWGVGIATEAVRQMTPYVFENFEINRIVAEVFEYNKTSMRVLEKNYFHLETVSRKGILKNSLLYDNYIWVLQKVY
jgi:RimJ/RimL family protein N-acetyltransferase